MDAPPLASSDTPKPRGRVHLAADSPCPINETNCLLESRLRIAGLTLFTGFAAFLAWDLFEYFFGKGTPAASHTVVLISHVCVTALLGLCAFSLCRTCKVTGAILRIKELLIFGLPAAFFAFYQFESMTSCAGHGYPLPNVSGMWISLIFVYALFVPNHWRRAAIVIGALAAAPVALSLLLIVGNAVCSEAVNANVGFVFQLGLMMSICGIASVLGVHTIGSLRREAFEAKQLGQYKLGELIGSGGMGEVYLAEHQLMKRPCAIKVIRPAKAGDSKVIARFEREVRFTSKLSHWNSIEIFDYGRTDDGTFYYVMEYLPGMNLDELVKQHGPLPPERVIYLLRQTCDALAEAHSIGLIHRDIKPANIFAAQRGGHYDVAKLLDFGLVKPMTEKQSLQITQEGTITGSPLFVSPEQVTGDVEPDGRSDIYSLGAVAYFLLTGEPPFDHANVMKILIAHSSEAPRAPSAINPAVPRDVDDIVLTCLSKRPDERYASVADLAAALDDCGAADGWSREKAEAWWNDHQDGRPVERQLAAVLV